MAIGYAGSIAGLNALVHRFQPPVFRAGEDIDRYISIKVVDELAKSLGSLPGNDDADGRGGWHCEMLIGIRGMLYTIQGDMSALRLNEPFTSIGSGSPYTLGAMTAIEQLARDPRGNVNIDPVACVVASLSAAARLQPGLVGGDLYVERVGFTAEPIKVKRAARKRSKVRKKGNRKRPVRANTESVGPECPGTVSSPNLPLAPEGHEREARIALPTTGVSGTKARINV